MEFAILIDRFPVRATLQLDAVRTIVAAGRFLLCISDCVRAQRPDSRQIRTRTPVCVRSIRPVGLCNVAQSVCRLDGHIRLAIRHPFVHGLDAGRCLPEHLSTPVALGATLRAGPVYGVHTRQQFGHGADVDPVRCDHRIVGLAMVILLCCHIGGAVFGTLVVECIRFARTASANPMGRTRVHRAQCATDKNK